MSEAMTGAPAASPSATGSPKPDWRPTALLLASGGALLVAALLFARGARALALAPLLLLLPWLTLGLVPALAGQGKTRSLVGPLVAIFAGVAILAAGLWLFGWWPGATLLHVGGAALFALGLSRATFNLLATRESAEREVSRGRSSARRHLGSCTGGR